jgi:hypothetical protein
LAQSLIRLVGGPKTHPTGVTRSHDTCSGECHAPWTWRPCSPRVPTVTTRVHADAACPALPRARNGGAELVLTLACPHCLAPARSTRTRGHRRRRCRHCRPSEQSSSATVAVARLLVFHPAQGSPLYPPRLPLPLLRPFPGRPACRSTAVMPSAPPVSRSHAVSAPRATSG